MLYEHQRKIIADDKKRCGLFLSTGSGKTRTALELAEGKILVICPKTQKLDQNWERELQKMNSTKTITVISKETFRRDYESIPYHDTVILDEADTMLGVMPTMKQVKRKAVIATSQIFESINTWIKRHKPKRIYLVTATPTRTPMCVWGASELLGAKWDFYKFRDTFYGKVIMGRREVYMARKDNTSKDRLAKCVNALGYTGRLTEYFDVPEQTYRTDYVEITDEQKKAIVDLSLEYPDPLVLLGKTLQVENGILAGTEYEEGKVFSNNKINKLLDYALEFPKMVIFVKYTQQIKQIYSKLKDEGYTVLTLTGETKNRKELLEQANELEDCILICQAQISAGYELPTFPVMIFASMTYSIVDRLQAEGRILRANALKKNLYITLVVRPYKIGSRYQSIDDAVNKAIINKVDFNERIYLQ